MPVLAKMDDCPEEMLPDCGYLVSPKPGPLEAVPGIWEGNQGTICVYNRSELDADLNQGQALAEVRLTQHQSLVGLREGLQGASNELIDRMQELFFFCDISRPHIPEASSYHGSDVSFRFSLVLSLQTFIGALAIAVYVVACPWI